MKKTISLKKRQQRKFLVRLPMIVVPFLCLAFYAMGGGHGQEDGKKETRGSGFNMTLPPAVIDPKEDKMDKLAYYERADRDSARKKELIQMDPNRQKERLSAFVLPQRPKVDTQADVLLHKLEMLKRRVGGEEEVRVRPLKRTTGSEEYRRVVIPSSIPRKADTPVVDPELDRLNEMLDKIARLQGGEHALGQEKEAPEKGEVSLNKGVPVDKGWSVDKEVSIGVPAMVENAQELMNGATLAMRLASAVDYNGMTLPRGQLVYGMVSMNNDRMQVSIHSIRCGSSIMNAYWQVYDMDGLQGIRIPDGLGRQMARQSADQGVGSLNIANYDPSIGGQMAGAGIQVAKSFFSRRVRMVRVTVPAGYRVLLRDTRTGAGAVRVMADTISGRGRDSIEAPKIVPPVADSLRPYMHESVREGKARLTLKGVYRREGLVWLYMTLRNKGAMDVVPAYVNCTIRQEKHWRRMAVQEIPVQLIYDKLPEKVSRGDEETIMIGLSSFELGGDRRLVVQVGEQGGGKEWEIRIAPDLILHSR